MALLPRVVRRESGEEERFVLALEADHLVFQGHFPGNPILPGVMQVDWAIRLATEAYGPLGEFLGMAHLKFMSLAQPPEVLDLTLSFDRTTGRLTFTLAGPSDQKSTGIILFSPTKA